MSQVNIKVISHDANKPASVKTVIATKEKSIITVEHEEILRAIGKNNSKSKVGLKSSKTFNVRKKKLGLLEPWEGVDATIQITDPWGLLTTKEAEGTALVYHKKGGSVGFSYEYNYIIEADRDGSINIDMSNGITMGHVGIGKKPYKEIIKELTTGLQSMHRNKIFGANNGGNIFTNAGKLTSSYSLIKKIKDGDGSGQGSVRTISQLKDYTKLSCAIIAAITQVEIPHIKSECDPSLIVEYFKTPSFRTKADNPLSEFQKNWCNKVLSILKSIHYVRREVNAVYQFPSVNKSTKFLTSKIDNAIENFETAMTIFTTLTGLIGGIVNVAKEGNRDGFDHAEIDLLTTTGKLTSTVNNYLSSNESNMMSISDFAISWNCIYLRLLICLKLKLKIELISINDNLPELDINYQIKKLKDINEKICKNL